MADTSNKKQFQENLQQLRSKNSNKVQYLKRKQAEEEAEKQLKEYENHKPDSDAD